MASAAEIRPSPFQFDSHQGVHKSIPILPSSSASASLTPPRDPMDVTPSSGTSMGPPVLNSPVGERNGTSQQTNGDTDTGSAPNGTSAPAIGAAAAAQQPKVVQTAFIHKLYKCVCALAAIHMHQLTREQYARGSKHPTPHFVVQHQRELCHVAFERVLQSPVVRTSRSFGPLSSI